MIVILQLDHNIRIHFIVHLINADLIPFCYIRVLISEDSFERLHDVYHCEILHDRQSAYSVSFFSCVHVWSNEAPLVCG